MEVIITILYILVIVYLNWLKELAFPQHVRWVEIEEIKLSNKNQWFCIAGISLHDMYKELPQQDVKDPGHSAKSVGGRWQVNMHPTYVALHEVIV